MQLNSIFVVTIERSKAHRQGNLNRINDFGKKHFGIQVAQGGVDGSKLREKDVQNYIQQGIIRPSQPNVTSLDKMIFMDQFKMQRYMSGSEIGCFLSHLSFWNHMVKNNIGCALILEDDAYFDYDEMAREIHSLLASQSESDFQLVSLFKNPKQVDTKTFAPYSDKLERIDARTWGTVAYVLTLQGAKTLLSKSCPIKFPVDYNNHSIMASLGRGFIMASPCVTLSDDKTFMIGGDNVSRQGCVEIKDDNVSPPPNFIDIGDIKHCFIIGGSSPPQAKLFSETKNIIVDFEKLSETERDKYIIDGIISPNASPNASLFSKPLKRFLTSKEITEFLTHYQIWKTMIAEKIPYAIVMDEKIKGLETISQIQKITKLAPSGFSSILLYTANLGGDALEAAPQYLRTRSSTKGHLAYIISLMGALKYIKKLFPIETTVDLAMHQMDESSNSGYILKDSFFYSTPELVALAPNNPRFELTKLFCIGKKEAISLLGVKPEFFNIDPDSLSVENLLQRGNNIVSQTMVKDGAVWLEDKKRVLTKDEMAQYLANVSLWTIINQNNVEGAIITQDNLKLRGSVEEMDAELRVMLKNIPFGAYVVKLTPSQNKVKYNEHFYYASNLEPDCSAYYITKRGAEKLLGVHKPMRSTIKELMLNFGIISKSAYCVKKPIFIPK